MLSLSPPSDAQFAKLFDRSREEPVHSVHDNGFTGHVDGFKRISYSRPVGFDDIDFEYARAELSAWRHFPSCWVEAVSDGPTDVGQQVAVTASCLGLSIVNVCRVTSCEETHTHDLATFRIVYATVASHDLEGAEQFVVIWNKSTGQVSYEVTSYSRPRSLLAKISLPYIRMLQRRFVRESCNQLRCGIESSRKKLGLLDGVLAR